MAKYTIGTIIYENRVRRKITQEELSYGVCTPATLSKIENGIQMPRRKIFEALMQRLGLQTQYYFVPLSSEEMERLNERNARRKSPASHIAARRHGGGMCRISRGDGKGGKRINGSLFRVASAFCARLYAQMHSR